MIILVAAAVLIDEQKRILLAQRPPDKTFGGLWEFPGGKIEAGETPETALVRELREELDIVVEEIDLKPFTFASHSYGKKHLLMPVYLCRHWQGTPHGREGQALAWVTAADLRAYPMPPADEPLIDVLQKL